MPIDLVISGLVLLAMLIQVAAAVCIIVAYWPGGSLMNVGGEPKKGPEQA